MLPGEGRTAANARFKDYISVSSTTLPVGRPVTLNISGVLDWSAATSIAGRQGNSLSSIYLSSLVAVNQSTIFTGVYDDGDPNRVSPGDTFLANPHTVFSGVYQTRIGDTLEILGTLSGTVATFANSLPQYTEETIEWSNVSGRLGALGSAHTYITASDSNIQLVALSRHDYAPPVPEPETWAMLLCGLCLLLRLRRAPAMTTSEEYRDKTTTS